jgi:dTDP-4-dehydrorhamnose reductase
MAANVGHYRVLLIGANGQLGHTLADALKTLGEVKALTRLEADLSDPWVLDETLKPILQSFKPHAIVNAAAYTAVDKAETEHDLARRVNAHSVGLLAQLAQSVNAVLVHYSTDYVFDGSGTRPWVEDDETNPLSVYGQTKWLGEKSVAQHCARHLILRTSWVVGVHGNNFLKTMLRLAAERDALRVVADQIGAPTSTQLLAQVTLSMLKTMLQAESNDKRFGTYHVAASGETSWHAYAQYVIAGAVRRGVQLKVKPESIEPIETSAYPLPAPRPANSRLNTDKVRTNFGVSLSPWQEGVDAILDELVKKMTSNNA